MDNSNNLNEEYQYYLDNKKELLKKYKNRYVVIKDKKVVGNYKSLQEAVKESMKTYEVGSFLVEYCEETNEKQTFYSMVSFN